MDPEAQTDIKRLRRAIGVPDGNGHGWNGWKVARTAVVTTVATVAAAGAVRAAWGQLVEAAAATAIVYRIPSVVHGPVGKPELGLVRRTERLEERMAVAPDDVATIAEFARSLRAEKDKKQRGGAR